jgi:hypothetical protein
MLALTDFYLHTVSPTGFDEVLQQEARQAHRVAYDIAVLHSQGLATPTKKSSEALGELYSWCIAKGLARYM